MDENTESDASNSEDKLLHHVILSRWLPQENPYHLEDGETLMKRMIENVENLAEWIPSKTVELFERLKRINLECTESVISEEIASLKPGDTFAMFVRRQNCVIMIHVLTDAKLNGELSPNTIVATFPGRLHSREIYEHDSDIEYNYPQNAVKVDFSQMLRSEEFANQLCLLCEHLPIEESKKRNHVSKWLLTVLTNERSTTASPEEFPIITKKVRDVKVGETKVNYFQRCAVYMSVKVMLQHSLTMHLGPETGKFIYKIVMLKFLIAMCTSYKYSECDTFNIDLLSQMIAKLGRRIEKLSENVPDSIAESLEYNEFYNVSIDDAKHTIAVIRSKINDRIQRIQFEDEQKSRLRPLRDLNFEADTCHTMPRLREYLGERLTEMPQSASHSRYSVKPYRRYQNRRHTGSQAHAPAGHDEKFYWIGYENYVLHEMSRKDEEMCAQEMRQQLIDYREYAEEKYKRDPVMYSRLILVHLKLIAVLDRRATMEYPLLKKHRSCINSNIFSSLLLLQRIDMETALHLEKYFRMRNESAFNPGLIEEKMVSEASFSVKFARENAEIRKVRDEILKLDEANIQSQKARWSQGREKVEKIREQANRLGCTFLTDSSGDTFHAGKCKRCHLHHDAKKVRIEQYEQLLPKEDYLQLAIAFELQIPDTIAYLRDILYGFVKFCAGKPSILNIKGNWVEFNDISQFNESESKFVTLGSTKRRRLEYIHVDEPFKRLYVQNSFNCTYHVLNEAIPTSLPDDAIQDVCTFKTNGEYAGLQWTLNSTSHTENQVLSRQSECPQSLSLSEYKHFGALRADGHRLQLRKLFAMIETEALSFEKESVLSLIMQTLWECGVRETHSDFSDSKFCSAMIELLRKFVNQQKDNWMHPFKLVMATLISIRIFEINDDGAMADEIVGLLISIRGIVWDWIDKIFDVMHKAKNPTEASERDLRLKLIYVAITGSLTFSIFPKHKHYEKIFSIGKDLKRPHKSWLHFIISMRNNLLLYEINEDQLPSNLRMFLRLVEMCGLNLEPKMRDLITQDDYEVFEVIKMHWCDAIETERNTRKIEFYPESLNTCEFKAMINTVQATATIDIITGMFLVNGWPISRLPIEIMQDESYQRVFGNVALEVQPNAQHRFCTIQRNTEFRYEFQKFNDSIIITERNANGSDRELIHHKNMYGEFPFLLVQNYSHWWNKDGNYIEFRQRTFGQRFASKEAKVDYRLDLNTSYLIDMRTQQRMLNIKSMSYRRIVKRLSRLEHQRYIHVMEESANVISVDLLRMKLKFKIDCSDEDEEQGLHFESVEFSEMRISDTQNIGTLYGLNYGLVLESDSGSSTKRKILLMPNGQIHSECTDLHVSVDIETKNNTRSPPFFQYQVDEIVRQVIASNSSHESWFYLAYLHAITSHGEIEPFTRMSGTERALQILQSAFAWSSSPYETEAIKMLNGIAALSPIRKMDGYHQCITWPEYIPPRSAQDSFIFVVKKLLEDSQRLHGLHSNASSEKLDTETELTLNKREYWRCLPLQPNLRVSDSFIEHEELKTSLPDSVPFSFSTNTGIVSTLYHTNSFRVPKPNWMQCLTNRRQLKGITSKGCISNILYHSVYEEFPDLWISLYDAIRKQELNNEEIVLILTLFSHQNKEFGQAILALQAVAMNSNLFEDIKPPPIAEYKLASGTYSVSQLHSVLRNLIYTGDDNDNYAKGNEDELKVDTIVDRLAAKIEESWPCSWVNLTDEFCDVDALNANIVVNNQLSIWNENRQLNEFIEKIHERFKSLPEQTPYVVLGQYCPFVEPQPQNWPKYEIDFEEKIRQNVNIPNNVMDEAKAVWIENEQELSNSAEDWWKFIELCLTSDQSQHLVQAGLFPRMVPSMLLPKILTTDKDDPLTTIIGAWAVTIAREQRDKRIEHYSQRPDLKADMDREFENVPHVNWKPSERPEWLIFEVEQNLTIREIQIKVAEQMIEPPKKPGVDAKHSVMQLNMGEGKTAVIVPILAAILADGNQACQITVLKSLFSRNQKFLRQYLGGLLNRRIYTFPCRRDMPIVQYVEHIPEIYEECKTNKGVILTLPEYRLSMQLKAYESIQKGEIEAAKHFLHVHKWLNANVRNILDESDAILQSNYQLIYTVGNQRLLDGGSLRWSVIQACLKRIPIHMKTLYEKYGKEKIEFDDNYMRNKDIFGALHVNHRSDIFTPCRIIDEEIFDHLKAALVEDFIGGSIDEIPEISDPSKQCLKYILTQKTLDKRPSHLIENFSLAEQNILMILSGLLRFEVLKLALTKRWRVNYGVDKKGQRKMAIPFKAKDVAADMTEFGHPDVAICFTQLSYYYSGLDDDQMHQLFEILKNKQNPGSIYGKWIQSIPRKLVNGTISKYTGINLDNPNQRDQLLFPMLRFNMHVIDFWLDNVVYPYEAKIFEQKLMCTTWDLCSDQLEHRVTGFSGTNDTKNLLPMPIAQNDLDELESTNENVRQILLQPENQSYESLPTNVSAKEILERLTERKIPVLLDSGALMLELSNEQVATEWLKMTPEATYDAAVYFDSRDILQTIDRNGTVTEFDCSVYRENLNRCLVYLDDVHTRGTDLKFPLNWKGCATLSGDITRDKTVQSCMRMRQLGTSHSICFWASCEADIRIRKRCNLSAEDPVTNENVIEFISSNSKQLETANMVHWTAAALNYTKKLIGHKLFDDDTTDDDSSMEQLYAKCVDDEFVNLIDMYGDKEEALLTQIAWSKFDNITSEHRSRANKEIKSFIRKMQDNVDEKLNELAPDVKKFSNALDEEQEKELEQEIEEQRQIERPPPVKAATPIFDESLKKLILNGATEEYMKTQRSLISIAASLGHTQMFKHYRRDNKEAWAKHIFVTKDFKTVIDSLSQSCDEFLRPVWWVARIEHAKNTDILVLLSSYECNRLFSTFQKSRKSTLFMYRPRINKMHSNLLDDINLMVTGKDETELIDIEDEVQIGVYAGMMYFESGDEQNAYCDFMGLIPRPRTKELERAFESGIIQTKGYVPIEKRQYSEAIASRVGQCKFQDNPVDLAVKLVEAHHQTLLKESHVAAILERSTKLIADINDDEHDD
ncbi:uncharacterized protein LOC129566134 [Sitodiplosis mosellana]|uniref:uncharacterized protein LOC129566134 n=1 Tax=Sitodiplosis mosellana TaxID=263140 RepID=UPI002443FD7E|nr:uncharacterized protein LOC129566134 [Sitodiplosis mosellana]